MITTVCKATSVSDMHTDTTSSVCTEVDELLHKFGPKKEDSLALASIYSELGMRSRAFRVHSCGDILEFSHEFDASTGQFSEKGKLAFANFCRDLLCPMCAWRKSLKQIAEISLVLNSEIILGYYKYLMLTLTIPNVPYGDLDKGIDKLHHGFDRMMRRSKYRKIIKGYYRSLEVTVNEKTETFHPHLHVMLLVDKNYGTKNQRYLRQSEILQDWRDACRDQTISQVDIRVAYQSKSRVIADDLIPDKKFTIESAALELAKYAAKVPSRCYKASIIAPLLKGLAHRRTYSYGGVLKDAFVALNLEDIETADLVHIDDDVPAPVISMIVRYGWTPSGYQIINTRMEGVNANEWSQVC